MNATFAYNSSVSSNTNYDKLADDSKRILRENVPSCILWIAIGLPSAVTSILVIAAIGRSKNLRSRYYTNILHIALSDLGLGGSHICMGLKRLVLVANGMDEVSTPFRCSFEFSCVKMFALASGGHTMALAIDRLMAIMSPVWYHNSGTASTKWINLMFWVIAATVPCIQAAGFVDQPLITNCIFGFIWKPWALYFIIYLQNVYVVVTVILYALVAFAPRMHISKDMLNPQQRARQQRVNKLCALIAFTFMISWGASNLFVQLILWVFPAPMAPLLVPYSCFFAELSISINFGLYWYFDRDFKTNLKYIVGGPGAIKVNPVSGASSHTNGGEDGTTMTGAQCSAISKF